MATVSRFSYVEKQRRQARRFRNMLDTQKPYEGDIDLAEVDLYSINKNWNAVREAHNVQYL